MVPPLPRTVIVDYYDSYTNNLLILFTQLYSDAEVLRKVVVIKADKYDWATFQREVIPNTDCVILSPGPGRPDHPADIGFGSESVKAHPVPILGVCLGHQAIGVAFGGKIMKTPKITHGHVVRVVPVTPPKGLFASPVMGSKPFEAVVYNSSCIDPSTVPDESEVTAWSDPQNGSEPTIQGSMHKELPIWGVQYHPESISSTHGTESSHAFSDKVHEYHGQPPVFPRLERQLVAACTYRVASSAAPTRAASPAPSPTSPTKAEAPQYALEEESFGSSGQDRDTAEVYERMVRSDKNRIGEIWSDGKSPSRPTTTSLAVPKFVSTYSLATRTVRVYGSVEGEMRIPPGETFFSLLDGAQTASAPVSGGAGGFRGGWTGWFTYEMKAESSAGYNLPIGKRGPERLDAVWAWVDSLTERAEDGQWTARGVVAEGGRPSSLLLDWSTGLGVTFGVKQADFDTYAGQSRDVLSSPPRPTSEPAAGFPRFRPRVSGEEHMTRIDKCRDAISEGESYELNQTTSFLASLKDDPYPTYLRLRTFNPAYYSAFIHFPTSPTPKGKGLAVISSSPERFLQITGGEIEMRPIKGTAPRVRPGQCVCADGRGCDGKEPGSAACTTEGRRVDEQRGKELSEDSKERAENSMIVDSIRSDSLSCCVPSTVTVPQSIALESYGVHNLVTTVRGRSAPHIGPVEATKRCFPPGSMTGAPKSRTVQSLDGFEAGYPRGIYSGASGYFSLCGSSDLSVVIRTMVSEGEDLSIGAGGAITWLSDRAEEWKEVLTKVQSVVGPSDS